MARSGSQFPISDAARSAAALDRQIEDSLRRQFAIPSPLANPSQFVSAHPEAGSSFLAGWSLNLTFQRSITLRQAAGLLLAATLWGSAGLLVFKHVDTGSNQRLASAAGSQGIAISPNGALAQLTLEYARPGSKVTELDLQAATAKRTELWNRLESELRERYGAAGQARVRTLRESKDRIELLSVSDSFAGNQSLLMVSARVDGQMSAVLFEATEENLPRLRVPAGQPTGGEVAPNTEVELQLFRGRIAGGFAYEISATQSPLLMPLLVEDAALRPILTLRPERYRAPYSAAHEIVP